MLDQRFVDACETLLNEIGHIRADTRSDRLRALADITKESVLVMLEAAEIDAGLIPAE